MTASLPGRRGPPARGAADSQACLAVEPAHGDGPPEAIRLVTHDPSLLSALAGADGQGIPLQRIVAVSVLLQSDRTAGSVPPVAGHYALPGDGVRFTPHFPFESRIRYRVRFDPRPLNLPNWQAVLELDIAPEPVRTDLPAEVEGIFPSADKLPENVLRFYVRFSQPMRRGHAGTEVLLLGPDDQPVADALYRAPVELWDRNMRCLTVLLDPGRLKRGVGPNRLLGPPLRMGQCYTLVVGAGMTAASGLALSEAVRKRFRVVEPVREQVSTDEWSVHPPRAGSREPLRLRFNRPLDWALMLRALAVTTEDGSPVSGRAESSRLETEIVFTPVAPWVAQAYRVSIATNLEDICGNDFAGPFDRPLGGNTAAMGTAYALTFRFHPTSHHELVPDQPPRRALIPVPVLPVPCTST